MNKFEIYDMDAEEDLPIEIGKFPGGEIRVKIATSETEINHVQITAILLDSDDVMTLVMIVDALREFGVDTIRLKMPYIPYARQDRVCNVGEAFSIRAFANIINSLEFKSVVVWDAHSIVSTTLIENCINIPQSRLLRANKELLTWMVDSTDPIYLIAPDAGSVGKATIIAQTYPTLIRDVLYAEKVRELSSGKIIATRIASDIPADFESSRVLICDDICDGGRTFIELAKVLKEYNPKEMSLYVTHGIFSQGLEVLRKPGTPEAEYKITRNGYPGNTGLFDNVWCSLNFKDYK